MGVVLNLNNLIFGNDYAHFNNFRLRLKKKINFYPQNQITQLELEGRFLNCLSIA